MRIFVVSRSGNYNSELDYPHFKSNEVSLYNVLASLKQVGGYFAERRGVKGVKVLVPFHEIEHIREAD